MTIEERLKALEALLKWLEDGGSKILNEPYYGMCAWVRIYHGEDGEAMNDDVTEQYLVSLGLIRPENDYCHWFPSPESHRRIALVKQTIELLKSNPES